MAPLPAKALDYQIARVRVMDLRLPAEAEVVECATAKEDKGRPARM
jgi:hypothetical protein